MFEIVSEARCFRAAQIFRHLPADRGRLSNNRGYCEGVVEHISRLTLQQLPNYKNIECNQRCRFPPKTASFFIYADLTEVSWTRTASLQKSIARY